MVNIGDITIQGQAVITPNSVNGVTSRDISVTGTQAITGIGFKPSTIIIFANVNGVAGNASWGFGDNNTNERNLSDYHAAVANSYQNEGGQIVSIYTASGVSAYASLTSLDTDGFTLTWGKTGAPTGTVQMKWLAFK